MTYYAQHSVEGESATVKQQRAIAERYKRMTEWMNVILLKLQIWERNGPSEALRKDILEASQEWGKLFQEIMGKDAPRIEGPKR